MRPFCDVTIAKPWMIIFFTNYAFILIIVELKSIGYEQWFIILFNFFCSSDTNRVFNLTYTFHPFIPRAKRGRWARKCIFSFWKNYWTKLLLWSCNSNIVAEKLQSDQTAPLSPDKRATDRVKGQGSGQSLLQLPLLSLTLLRLSPADLASTGHPCLPLPHHILHFSPSVISTSSS